MFSTSNETAALDDALAAAQGEIEAAAKDKVNPAFKSRYADLSAVWDAIRPALSKHKIAVTQWPVHSDDNRLHLVTRLAHGGEWIRCEFSIPIMKQDAHGYGSAVTYIKRYALAAAVGVVADEDDDGNGAAKPKPLVKKDQRPLYTQLQGEVDALPSPDAVRAWWKANRERIWNLDETWQGELQRRCEGRISDLSKPAAPADYAGFVAALKDRLQDAADATERAAVWEEIEGFVGTGQLLPPDRDKLKQHCPEVA